MKKVLARLYIADWFIVTFCLALVVTLQFDNWSAPFRIPSPATGAVPMPDPDVPAAPAKVVLPSSADLPDGKLYAPRVFGESSHIATVSTPGLTSSVVQVYREEFVGRPYFGAFAVGRDGAWGYTSGSARRSIARAEALALCADANGNAPCTIFAELLPYAPADTFSPQEDTLSFRQATELRKVREGQGPRAFARAKDGNLGTGRGNTAEEAATAARLDCLKRQRVSGRRIRLACEVVAVWGD